MITRIRGLVHQIAKRGVKVWFLLLGKGFFCVEVIRYLQSARYPFLMPTYSRGPRPRLLRPGSLHECATRKRSGWISYTWRDKRVSRATVQLAIVCRNHRGTRGQRGRFTQLCGSWGKRPLGSNWIYQTYRKRFGIETSYRQMNEGRIQTSTRNPLLRLLFVGIALILRNVWVWCHLNWMSERRGPLHGNQLRKFFHGYYQHYCYLPLYIFCEGWPLLVLLRPANIDASAGSVLHLQRIVARLRNSWPDVTIVIRGDSGFCREQIMRWCEENQVDFIFGLARTNA